MLGHAVVQALRDASYAVDWLRDGLDVLRELRARDDSTPVLVITARDAVDQRIEGLDRGADDYLVKPFAVGELLARMRALGRRRAGAAAPVLSNGVLALDPASKAVVASGTRHSLSNREFALLRELLVRPGAVLSRAELEDRIYGWGEEVESNTVEVHVHNLRKKLGADAIRTIRGVGYVIARS